MCRQTLADRALEIALAEEGQREVGTSNWGNKVTEYLKAANVRDPAPWCAAYANWAWEKAAEEMNVDSPLERVPLQAYVQSYVDHGKANGWVIPNADARPGDLFCMWFENLRRYAHIGFVVKNNGARIETIEGNTNVAGARDGIMVAKRSRANVSPGLIILRPQ
jgi:hypothetical protein